MRRSVSSVQEVKSKLAELKGKPLSVSVNKGRKRVLRLRGEIVDLFPSVFTFRAETEELVSFSYSDVICGDILFKSAD
ncbi:MAG: hypothetical protein HDT28_04775 [Clostridiales bacterium]|nr:hypothetical protein [Clostridiales bacterium]